MANGLIGVSPLGFHGVTLRFIGDQDCALVGCLGDVPFEGMNAIKVKSTSLRMIKALRTV